MKKTKIFSLALLPVLIGLVVSCSGNGGGSESIAPEPSSSSRTASSATSTTSSKSSSEPEPEEFTVTFNVTKDAGWGNSVVMIGDFCEWEEEDALEMEWTAGNVWTTSMTFTEETTLEFKFALVDGESNFTYEADPNREVTLTEDDELDFEWQGDQPGPTPEVGYTMKINDGEAITLNKMDDEEGQPYVAQYCTDATLTKDGVVTFYQDGLLIEKIGPDADGEGFKNNIRKPVQEVNNFVIHNDYTPEEGDQSVYFKVWNDGGFSFSGMGYKEPVYTAKVNEDNLPLVKGEGLGGEVQYTAEGTQVEMGDIIKFFKDDVIDSEVELDNSVTAFTILEGVLTCVEAGKYNIYYQPEEGKIFVSEYSEAVITYKYYFEEYNNQECYDGEMTKFGEEGWYYIKWDLGNQNRSIQTRVDKYVDEVKDSSTYPFGNGAFNIGNDTHTTGYIVFNFTDPTASWTVDTPWATYTKDSNNIYYVSGSFLAE